MTQDGEALRKPHKDTAVSQDDLAQALVRIFGRDAVRQARENAASNARAGNSASEKMWLGVAEILEQKSRAAGGLRGNC